MTDNVHVEDSSTGADVEVATDDVGGVAYQRVKLDIGADGAASGTAGTAGVPLRVDPTGSTTQPVSGTFWQATQPVSAASLPLPTGASTLAEQQTQSTRVGDLTEAAPASDTASSGLNGRLQRIAQRLTSLIALLPASLGQKAKAASLAVTLASDQDALPVTDNGGSLTVDGTVTVTQGTAANLNVTEASAAAIAASASVLDDWDESDRAKVNPIVGQAGVAGGSGTVGATTQRVTLATDVALPTGTNAVGRVGHDTTGLGDGRKTVASAGTAEALAGSTAAKRVHITAETDNTGLVVVGSSTVVAALATRRGTPISAGDTLSLNVDNLNEVYLDVTVNGDGATYTYET